MPEGIIYKKTKGNPPIYGGKFGSIHFHIYKNRNVKNTVFFVLSFAKFLGNGRWANLNVSMSEVANMRQAIEAAALWLRKNG